MAFTPIILNGGLPGLNYVKRTMAKQIEVMTSQQQVKREGNYYKENISKIKSGEELVRDPVLLRVTLTSFGLQDDFSSKFYIEKILSSDLLDKDSFANKISNKKYKDLTSKFGFGTYEVSKNTLPNFADDILKNYERKLFEISIGAIDNNMRLALNAETELKNIASSDASENTKWYSMLSSPPLRKVFEGRFNLGNQFGIIDIDRQVDVLKKHVKSAFGEDTISQFSDPSRIDKLVRLFMVRSSLVENSAGGYSSNHTALNILRGSKE